jgi:hypothetical protein
MIVGSDALPDRRAQKGDHLLERFRRQHGQRLGQVRVGRVVGVVTLFFNTCPSAFDASLYLTRQASGRSDKHGATPL